ncbi:hydrogenase maturation nickel metallochaperone HypA [Sulfurimonas marina]|uniref:Hydrogenase maturation factor HypA n=1 Tax=Sulfurimonas marina TaxID=2590551 RepID=A0A7M1AY90_9BACT|nr:hydrogenase maturation nickel metallochaperone HypA [Sulfurimonas marina]QOP41352.1 hydrogenase maturation nickel metallochaperone HypA [Sulfurimonas marina]
MHEYSVVQALLEQVEDLAKENQASKVTKIVTKIGVMSGIEIHLFEVAFNSFKEKTICEEAEFIIQIQPVVIRCNSCGEENTLEKIHYCCPECESTNVEVIDGEDMYLMSLEMQ